MLGQCCYDLVTCSYAPRSGRRQGRHRRPLPAARPQRVGPGGQGRQDEGAAQLRPRGPARPGRDRAAGRVAAPGGGSPAGRRRCALPDLAYQGSVAYGGSWLLDQLWQRLGIDEILAGVEQDPPRRLHRAGAVRPGRQPGAGPLLQARRRALGRPQGLDRPASRDHRRRVLPGDGRAVPGQGRGGEGNLRPGREPANLEVDLLFFDTTSTYFELDEEDGPVPRDKNGNAAGHDTGDAAEGQQAGIRAYGQRRRTAGDDLPQVVIGLGRHPRRHPGPHLVLAREHQRLRADPPGQGRHAGLDPVPDRVGRRPRLHLRRQPPLPAIRRRPLHHRREAGAPARPKRTPRCPGRAATRTSPRTARQGGPGFRLRAVRDLLQPRRRRARRPSARPHAHPARRAHPRHRQAPRP